MSAFTAEGYSQNPFVFGASRSVPFVRHFHGDGGHYWPKFCGEGHKNIVDWGVVRVGVELLQISKLFSIWFKL